MMSFLGFYFLLSCHECIMYAELDCLHSLELTYGLGSTKNDIFKVIKSAIFIAVSNHKKIKFLAPL